MAIAVKHTFLFEWFDNSSVSESCEEKSNSDDETEIHSENGV